MAESGAFSFLSQYPPEQVAAALAGETTLMAGAVLAQLPPAAAAKIMANMNADRQREVVGSMRKSRNLPPEIAAKLAAGMRDRLSVRPPAAAARLPGATRWQPRPADPDAPVVNAPPARPGGDRRKEALEQALSAARTKRSAVLSKQPHSAPQGGGRHIDGMALAAEILRLAPAEVRGNIRSQEPGLYTSLRKRMFIFEDLARSPDRTLAEVFGRVDSDIAALALKFAPDELRDRALAAVSPRRAQLLLDEAGAAGKGRVKLADIEKAQADVLQLALELQRSGQVIIDPDDPDTAPA